MQKWEPESYLDPMTPGYQILEGNIRGAVSLSPVLLQVFHRKTLALLKELLFLCFIITLIIEIKKCLNGSKTLSKTFISFNIV